jgi:hypothetical protein
MGPKSLHLQGQTCEPHLSYLPEFGEPCHLLDDYQQLHNQAYET